MSEKLIALAYVSCGLVAVGFLYRLSFSSHRSLLMRVLACWLLGTAVLFLANGPAVMMMTLGLLTVVLSPTSPTDRAAYYCGILPIMPVGVLWDIPSPGIGTLFRLEYPELLSLTVLLPILFNREARTPLHHPSREALFFAMAYVILTIFLDFRLTTFSNGIRLALEHIIAEGILILALARIAPLSAAFRSMTAGLLIGAALEMSIGYVQTLTNWFLYDVLSSSYFSGVIRYDLIMLDRGSGAARTPGTMSPIPNGIYMAMGLVLTAMMLCVERRKTIGVVFIPLMAFIMVLTDARAAPLLVSVAALWWLVYSTPFRRLRGILIVSSACIITLTFSDLFAAFLQADEHGTFMYRWLLIVHSMDAIGKAPMFGSPDYIFNPVLQQLAQGDQFVDIVNAYLDKLLRYGLFGLALFVLPLWKSVALLSNARKTVEKANDRTHEQEARLALGLLVGFAASVFTVSFVSVLGQFYWILIFVAFSYVSHIRGTSNEAIMRRPEGVWARRWASHHRVRNHH